MKAHLKGRKQLVLFDDVNVDMLIECKLGEMRVPMTHAVRQANRKSFLDIHREIRRVQEEPVSPGKGLPPFLRPARSSACSSV